MQSYQLADNAVINLGSDGDVTTGGLTLLTLDSIADSTSLLGQVDAGELTDSHGDLDLADIDAGLISTNGYKTLTLSLNEVVNVSTESLDNLFAHGDTTDHAALDSNWKQSDGQDIHGTRYRVFISEARDPAMLYSDANIQVVLA